MINFRSIAQTLNGSDFTQDENYVLTTPSATTLKNTKLKDIFPHRPLSKEGLSILQVVTNIFSQSFSFCFTQDEIPKVCNLQSKQISNQPQDRNFKKRMQHT